MPKRVLVVGGGVSGLMAANELARRSCVVILLEANDRLGGRIWTQKAAGTIIELGAEFIHGKVDLIERTVRQARLQLRNVSERNQIFKNGRLHEVEIWGRVGDVINQVNPKRPDHSFAEFLDGQRVDQETREMALGFVEGFNASDAKKIGAHSLLRAEFESERHEGDSQKRIRKGYSALVDALKAEAERRGVTILLNHQVKRVKWRQSDVEMEVLNSVGQSEALHGGAAIITLPLGVLKAGTVTFEPELTQKRDAIRELHFGNVAKLTFVFRKIWWKPRDFGFIHAFDEPIPTWWSDPRGPVLVGWAAGPKADQILKQNRATFQRIGIGILAKVFRCSPAQIRGHLANVEFHDWAADPEIRGAYSYIPVNGLDLPKLLAEPVDGTLFFAGEATAVDAQMGTVAGAMRTGLRAARELLEG